MHETRSRRAMSHPDLIDTALTRGSGPWRDRASLVVSVTQGGDLNHARRAQNIIKGRSTLQINSAQHILWTDLGGALRRLADRKPF